MNEIITKIETLNPEPSETIVLFFNAKDSNCTFDMVKVMYHQIKDEFPSNTVIALPDTISLEVFEKKTLTQWLKETLKDLKENKYGKSRR